MELLGIQILKDVILGAIALWLLIVLWVDHERKATENERLKSELREVRRTEREERDRILQLWYQELDTHEARNAAILFKAERLAEQQRQQTLEEVSKIYEQAKNKHDQKKGGK